MSDPFIVEIWGEPAGIVLREGNAFRFHATARPFFELDGIQFSTPAKPGSRPPDCRGGPVAAPSTIDRRGTAVMTTRQSFLLAFAIAAALMSIIVAVRAQTPADVVLTDVSYDSTRELPKGLDAALGKTVAR